MDCVFCKIAAGEIPSKFLYEDKEVVAFADLHPQAPVHVLVIPRKHIQSLNHLAEAEMPLFNHMVRVAQQVAKDRGIYERGYKLVINTGKEGGQVIQHLHLHILGGRNLDG